MLRVQELNAQLEQRPLPAGRFGAWVDELAGVNKQFPLSYPAREDVIMPQWAIQARHLVCPSRLLHAMPCLACFLQVPYVQTAHKCLTLARQHRGTALACTRLPHICLRGLLL
jgi:hypothetical protein